MLQTDGIKHLEYDMQELLKILDLKDVVELIVHPYLQSGNLIGHVLVEFRDTGILDFTKLGKVNALSAIKVETMMSVLAGITGNILHHKHPYLECQIPKYGFRFTGVIPPVSAFPSFCIRKHSNVVYTLSDFVQQGVLQASSYNIILTWLQRRFNILIAGGTGSGKTTLANAILHEINLLFPQSRMVIIEDVRELQFDHSLSLSLLSNEFFDISQALRTTLRFCPDRIIMGEVRGFEAYTLLKAWNTGHPGGIATIHANSIYNALHRFESCIREHHESVVNREEIAYTINGIIGINNITVKEDINGEYVNKTLRKVTGLRQIISYDNTNDVYQDLVFDREDNVFV